MKFVIHNEIVKLVMKYLMSRETSYSTFWEELSFIFVVCKNTHEEVNINYNYNHEKRYFAFGFKKKT